MLFSANLVALLGACSPVPIINELTQGPTISPTAFTEATQPPKNQLPEPTELKLETQIRSVVQPTLVRFEPGATTWATEISMIPTEVVQFAVYALEGQMMQVFVSGEGIDISIRGEDETVLMSEEDFDPFWRGELPSSQNYFVELTKADLNWLEDAVSISIAIAPSGQELQSFHYSDPKGFFELEFSDYFAIDPAPGLDPFLKGEELLRLAFVGTEFLDGTNLVNAFLVVARTDVPEIVTDCADPIDPYENDQGIETIGDQEYFKWSSSDGGMGHFYEITRYRTTHAEACYEVVFYEEVLSVGHFAPEIVIEEFDQSGVNEKMLDVLQSLEFNG